MRPPRLLLAFLIAAVAPSAVAAQTPPVKRGDLIRMVLYRTDGGGSVSSARVLAVVETTRNANDCLGVRIDATTTSRAELADVSGGARPSVMSSFSTPISDDFFIEVREEKGDNWRRVESGELRSAGIECVEGET
jgi:hypothetical protein